MQLLSNVRKYFLNEGIFRLCLSVWRKSAYWSDVSTCESLLRAVSELKVTN